MRRRLAVIIVTVMATMTLAMGASADNLGPCNDGGAAGVGPGHSDYAQHHIVPATLGNNAHKPGTHGGYSVCLGTGRISHQP
jgi:hypothetical protein